MTEPIVQVGILTGKKIPFSFTGEYRERNTGQPCTGNQQVEWKNNFIYFKGEFLKELLFEPLAADSCFTLPEVTIGVNFHWERKEEQKFQGGLKLIGSPEGIVVINRIRIEDYLSSVISSEMSATASKEFLKAHAVISRSWLLAQLDKNRKIETNKQKYKSVQSSGHEWVRWYDREDHTLFDVCADDHCQRYQGITRAARPLVKEVIRETAGEILMYENSICDTRFSKCCGGVTELFESCWEPVHHPYLIALKDSRETDFPDLTIEQHAFQWIQSSPEAFCNTTDKQILGQVLNNYDQETTDFFRWVKEYTQEELAALVSKRSGVDFGEIVDLIPLKRGSSGRIERLQIVGTKRTYIIGKELEIRRTLSTSHLYSSAFIVEKLDIQNNIPGRFRIKGAGWGHGVGLCQIGAAVMGSEGYTYNEILAHYFRNAEIKNNYGK
ncbi:MAG: SpoIID/LytB domain-containing protein [Tannerellaceae bacterium]|nr:SpoIID/LytB domain-containing protein [Tannerellaceae bacterium]